MRPFGHRQIAVAVTVLAAVAVAAAAAGRATSTGSAWTRISGRPRPAASSGWPGAPTACWT